MAELQLGVLSAQDTRHQIQAQVLQWEENLERLHCEQFRLRCYMASLQGGELPNPKVYFPSADFCCFVSLSLAHKFFMVITLHP